MDLLTISAGVVALILGAAIGWLLARSRFTTAIAELKANLVLERRFNSQVYKKFQVDAVPSLIQAPDLILSGEPKEPLAHV
jgi:hypothetical protein